MSESEFVGVDGCPCGWFSVGFNSNGDYELKAFFLFGDLLDYYKAAKLILVDMPIGLPPPAGPPYQGAERHCDPEARGRLSIPLKRSVFRAPTRAAVRHFARNRGDKVGARAVEIEQTGGKSIPPVTFGIMPKIDEVDLVMSAREPDASLEVREIHPELCFWALNYGRPLDFRKHTAEGIEERICVLSKKGEEPRAKRILVEAWSKYQNNCVGKDDILDALAAAVTAYRGWPCNLQTLPMTQPLQTDENGLSMEMVFWQPAPAPEPPDCGD